MPNVVMWCSSITGHEIFNHVSEQKLQQQVLQAALALLARREHSLFELRQKLLARFPLHPQLIDIVLVKLQQDNYQSDERFAEAYVRSRAHKGFGVRRLRQELVVRGLSVEAIGTVLEPYEDIETSIEHIKQVWQKKFATLPADVAEKSRQTRFLLYRGFSQRDINKLFHSLTETT